MPFPDTTVATGLQEPTAVPSFREQQKARAAAANSNPTEAIAEPKKKVAAAPTMLFPKKAEQPKAEAVQPVPTTPIAEETSTPAPELFDIKPNQPSVEALAGAQKGVAFLKWLDPDGWHNVTFIRNNNAGTWGYTFPPNSWDKIEALVAEQYGKTNTYYAVNEPMPGARDKKLEEADIGSIRAVWVDIDPKSLPDTETMEERQRYIEQERQRLIGVMGDLRQGDVPPSVVVDSGGGVQAIFKLSAKLDAGEWKEAAKQQGRGLEAELDGDATHNIDRVMRLPGTINIPDDKKIKKGRVERKARVISMDDVAYSLDEIAQEYPPRKGPKSVDPETSDKQAAEIASYQADLADYIGGYDAYTDLPEELRQRHQSAMELMPKFKKLWETGEPYGPKKTGSDGRFCLAQQLHVAGGFDIYDCADLMWAWKYAAPDSDREDRVTARAVARVWVRSVPAPKQEHDREAFFRDLSLSDAGVGPTPDRVSTGIKVIRGRIDAKTIPTRKWLTYPNLPAGVVTQMVGEPGVSKSTLALRYALAIATEREDILNGRDAHGNPITKERLHLPGSALIYNAEDSIDEMERRLEAYMAHLGIQDSDFKHAIILWSGLDHGHLTIMSREKDRGSLEIAKGAYKLRDLIIEHRPVFVALDPQLSLLQGASENDNIDINDLYQFLSQMAAAAKISIAVIHHPSKGTRNAAGDMGMGSGAFAAARKMRSGLTLTKVSEDDKKRWGFPKEKKLIQLHSSKNSYSEDAPTGTALAVYLCVGAPVGNGSGLSVGASLNAREMQEAMGDWAPVLELVDVKAREAAAKTKPRDDADAKKIAEIANELMGGVDETPLSQIQGAIGLRMRDQSICEANQRQQVMDHIVANLGGQGVDIQHDGQSVRIRAVKKGTHRTAAWSLVREKPAVVGEA